MKKSYLLLYSSRFGSRDEVKELVDSMSIITDWRFELPNSMFLISEASAQEIYNRLTKGSDPEGGMLVVEYSKNSQGWLNDKSWHLLEHKKRKPADE